MSTILSLFKRLVVFIHKNMQTSVLSNISSSRSPVDGENADLADVAGQVCEKMQWVNKL